MKKITTILLACVILSYYTLAVSYTSQINWLEFLAWEEQDFNHLNTVEYTYSIMHDDDILYTGSYADCYHALPDFESTYGNCFIMPV